MRTAFVNTLIKEAILDTRIYLLTGDLGFTVFEPFIKRFPDRFINMGVSEANMVGVATGLAHSGKIPIVYSIATFMSMRAYEQIRNDVAIHHSNVKIVGVGAGLSYGHAGPTHHSLEDITLMRTQPGMTVIAPSDPVSTTWATKAMLKNKGPFYLRLGKKGEPILHDKRTSFVLGKGVIIREGTDATIIANGSILANCLLAADHLKRENKRLRVIDMHTIKPIDEALIINSAIKTQYIFTVEEHTIIGGLGSAVAECISEKKNQPFTFKRIGIPDVFPKIVGNQIYLRHHFSLSPKRIANTIKKHLLKEKQNIQLY